jgi:pyruvate/2-oxoglutarate/acetoin dehydrogenase E1 component
VSLDPTTRTVHTASGRDLRADAVVVATGVRPRTLAGQAELAGVHVLRTLDDAAALRADLLTASRLVVVGEGVLGAEIAATAAEEAILHLRGPVTRVTAPDVPVPLAKLVDHYLPSVERIRAGVDETLQY